MSIDGIFFQYIQIRLFPGKKRKEKKYINNMVALYMKLQKTIMIHPFKYFEYIFYNNSLMDIIEFSSF